MIVATPTAGELHFVSQRDAALGLTIPARFARLIQETQQTISTETTRREDVETERRAALSPDQTKLEAQAVIAYAKTAVPGYTVAGPTLTPIEEMLQKIILARDYDALFKLIPLARWKPTWQLGKYSFVGNGARRYVPFTENDICRFVFSAYYQVQPGHVCPDSQRTAGVVAHWQKTQGHKARYPANDWKHIWPMYPGGGYPGQRYGCERDRPSRWVKLRKKVYIAAGIVAAIYLGPIVLNKVGGLLAGGAEGGAAAAGATEGIVGAGAKAGAAAVKIGKAGEVIATATQTGKFLTTVQTGVGYYNKANTINSIIKGELPPPPIGVTGATFAQWSMNVAKDLAERELKEEIGERAGEYFAGQLSDQEEAAMRAELEALQREIAKHVPEGTPIAPDPKLQPEIRQKITEMQNIERERGEGTAGIVLAVAIPTALVLLAA